ncbi:hypothetical protein A9Q81_11870 [Gammaproteobacteria bacterium 42_54_T18]|nr:hypothetical protein A9Q81_11870 [Gammaproteobacteria bacterium 42_54_T18]
MKRFTLVWALIMSLSVGESVATDFDSFDFLETNVSSVAKMSQPIKKAPGAVTVITEKQIKQLGIKSIAEAMRLVPGFHVDFSSPFTYVNRGANFPTARRLQVLIDGVSEVNPLVGVINWENFPVALERIESIEVVRSQSSAAHGANAFFGTINIVTKHPDDIKGAELRVAGSKKERTVYGGGGFVAGNTTIAMDYKHHNANRFDEFADGRPNRHDDMRVKKINVTTHTKIDSDQSIILKLGAVRSDMEHQLSQTEPFGTELPIVELDSNVASLRFLKSTKNHEFEAKVYFYEKDWQHEWDFCAPKLFYVPGLGDLYRDNSALVLAALGGAALPSATTDEMIRLGGIFTEIAGDPTSGDTVCGEINVDYRYKTYAGSISDVWSITEKLRASSSFQLDYRWMESETYNDGVTSIQKSKFFTNVEYLPFDNLTLNVGFMAESLGYDLGNPEISPRIGANLHINDSNTLKLVYSMGSRLIDGIEIIESNQVPVHFNFEVYGSTRQSPFLGYFPLYNNKDHVERIESTEVIHYVKAGDWMLETRVFLEELDNILNYQDQSGSSITALDRKGGEFTVRYKVSDIDVRFAGHYLDSDSKDKIFFDDYHAYGGSAYVAKTWGDITGSLSYYGTSAIDYSSYDRTDARIAKVFTLETAQVELSGMLSRHREVYVRALDYGGLIDGGKRDSVNEVTLEVRFTL